MKIYNKFVESKKEPSNKNDIWFDGSSWKMYKEGMWRSFTLPLDAAVEINKILQEDKSVLQQELKNYLKIQDSPFKKSTGNNSAVLKGTSNSATNKFATAFGEQTTASADRAFSEGLKTTASGTNSHAEGLSTLAQGQNSHAEGNKCKAIGNHSHVEGNETTANGGASHAEGSGTLTKNNFEHAEGKYNFSNKDPYSDDWGGNNTIHSVGIGISNNVRKNAHEILQNGKHYVYGIGGYNGTNVLDLDGETVTAYDLATVVNNKAELSDIHQSDWNAKEGEAGYIENRPFVRKNIEPIISNSEVVYENLDTIDVYIQCDDTIYSFPFGCDDYDGSFIETEKEIHSGMDFVIKARRYEYEMRVQSLTSVFDVNDIPKYITVFYVDRKLNQSDIDDTVLKITPQPLSDEDKNQALANLGINPVVWKYMCEPYVIEKGNFLPDYLLQLLLNGNPLILNLCKIKVVTEMYDDIAGANRPYVQLCNPIASRWGDNTTLDLSLQCITFYNNTYHTYHADIDIYAGGEICDIYEITE